MLIIFELREAAKVSLEDYLKLEREKKLNEESLMNQVTQLQNDKDELKTEIFKLKHKVEKVRMLLPADFQVYCILLTLKYSEQSKISNSICYFLFDII